MLNLRFVVSVLSFGMAVVGVGVTSAQDYPNKSIRIVAAAAGGGGDYTARQIAQGISGVFGQPVIVENRPANIAIVTVTNATPDGYTLLVLGATLWLTPILQPMNYDVERDFSPITMISRDVFILVVHPSVPVKSVKELIDLAKAKPGELNYSSSTAGAPSHLGMELLKSMTGVNIQAVPYNGTTPAFNGLLSGETKIMVADTALAIPQMKSGRVRALAVTSVQPFTLAPELPTMAASGVPGYELAGAAGMWAPAKTPVIIINRLNQEVVRFLNKPEVKERFLNGHQEIVANSPAQFAATIKSEVAKWSKLIKDNKIQKAF